MSNETLVLMLGHKSLVGKDTFFSFAKDYGFVRAAFADKLKSTVADLYGFNHEQMHGSMKDTMDTRYPNIFDQQKILCNYDDPDPTKEEGITDLARRCFIKVNPDYKPLLTPRRILQIFGQQQRSLFPDIWAAYVFNSEIPKLVEQGHNKIVITDFRFKNEARVALSWSQQAGNSLKIIKINRPSVIAKTGAGDISENDLNDFQQWDEMLDNSKDLEAYKATCITLIEKVLNR